ncbi:hypothetical protein DMENIID0001_091950 [Sergentomyia squamirostris]
MYGNSVVIRDGEYTKVIYTLIKEEQFQEAITALNNIEEVSSSRAGLSLLGYCYYQCQDFIEASNCYEHLIAIAPEVPEYKLYFAQCLYQSGLFDEALKVTQLVDAPHLVDKVRQLQSAIKYASEDYAGAQALLLQRPTGTEATLNDEGCLLYQANLHEDALQRFTSALQMGGFNPLVAYNAALSHFRRKENSQALNYIGEIVERGIRNHPELGIGAQADTEGVATIQEIINETTTAIWESLKCQEFPQFSVERFLEAAEGFKECTKIPNVIGALDGKHITLKAPDNSGSFFINYKKTYSIVLLAMCDANCRFTYIDVGNMGSISDGGTYRDSRLRSGIEGAIIPLPPPTCINNQTFPYVILADSAFPLKNYLMVPYGIHGDDDRIFDKLRFNNELSKGRIVIENAFGILCSRWRVLHTKMEVSVESGKRITLAACALHNFILTQATRYMPLGLVNSVRDDGSVISPGQSRSTNERVQQSQPYNLTRVEQPVIIRDLIRENLAALSLLNKQSK